MSIKTVEKVPDDLPPAHLFLDDLEEITGILRDCASPVIQGKSRNEELLSYVVGEKRCDTVDDLQRIGGRTTQFVIDYRVWQAVDEAGENNVFRMRDRSVSIHLSRFHSGLDQSGPSDSEKWLIHARIRAIFEKRKRRVRWIIAGLGDWGGVLLGVLLGVGFNLVVPSHSSHFRGSTALLLLGAYAVLVGYLLIGLFRHSVIEFRYSHDGGRLRAALAQAWVPTVSAIIGALVYALATSYLSKALSLVP
jgi:hypothetical protein